MADKDIITIPLELPFDEAAALAQLVKRISYEDCAKLANRHHTAATYYSRRGEADVMWSAVCMLQRELAEAGFAAEMKGNRHGL